MLTLILILTLFNTFLLFTLSFWIVNKNCPKCHQEKPINQLFKAKCSKCEAKLL